MHVYNEAVTQAFSFPSNAICANVEHNWFILSINFGAKVTVIRIFTK